MNATKYQGAVVLVFVLATAMSAEQVGAYGFCSVPREPSCVDMMGISKDEFTFQMCRNELESYRRQVQSYIRCLIDEVASEREDKTRKLNRAIDRFNCYAQGGSVCF